jgi:hypothetical protein
VFQKYLDPSNKGQIYLLGPTNRYVFSSTWWCRQLYTTTFMDWTISRKNWVLVIGMDKLSEGWNLLNCTLFLIPF